MTTQSISAGGRKRKIKQILVAGSGWIYAIQQPITEVEYNGEMAPIRWFRQGNREWNSKYVIEVEYQ